MPIYRIQLILLAYFQLSPWNTFWAPCGCIVSLNAGTTGSIKKLQAHANVCAMNYRIRRRKEKIIDRPIIRNGRTFNSAFFFIKKSFSFNLFFLLQLSASVSAYILESSIKCSYCYSFIKSFIRSQNVLKLKCLFVTNIHEIK